MTAGTIEWTGPRRWNPLRGCTRATEACRNCYAENMAARFSGPGLAFEGFAKRVTLPDGSTDARWTGKVELVEERLTLPLKWRTPTLCFTDTQSDFFHESLPDEVLDRRFAVMALAPHVHFQVLTKRWDRMREYLNNSCGRVGDAAMKLRKTDQVIRNGAGPNGLGPLPHIEPGRQWWPLPNVSLGVSVHDQACADAAIPALLATPAALRFVSYEPALGPVDWETINLAEPYDDIVAICSLTGSGLFYENDDGDFGVDTFHYPALDLIIAGDESGPGRRPADPDWYRQTRDKCAAAGVPFFLKQMHVAGKLVGTPELDGRQHTDLPATWRAVL